MMHCCLTKHAEQRGLCRTPVINHQRRKNSNVMLWRKWMWAWIIIVNNAPQIKGTPELTSRTSVVRNQSPLLSLIKRPINAIRLSQEICNNTQIISLIKVTSLAAGCHIIVKPAVFLGQVKPQRISNIPTLGLTRARREDSSSAE